MFEVLLPGEAAGKVLKLDEPLSFWGGLDASTGEVIDRRHPQSGATIAGTVLVMANSRGSSSSSSVLAEALHNGTGPYAIVLTSRDPMVVLGAHVAFELYGIGCPVVVVDKDSMAALQSGTAVAIGADGLSVA